MADDSLAMAMERQMHLNSDDDDAADRKHANTDTQNDESMDEDMHQENSSARRVISLGQLPPLPPADDEGELFVETDVYEESAYGADYAIMSGGSRPHNAPIRHDSRMLARTISLGSIASEIEDDFTPLATPMEADSHLAPLDEEGMVSPDVKSEAETTKDFLKTPKLHVPSVQVPGSVAKQSKNRRTVSPITLDAAMKQARNMTLKEQSSTIDRLLKENFDLKLKVMFLGERLERVSEEGVKETIAENVDLKTALANLQRDNKALRKRVKDLEKGNDDKMSRPTTANTTSSGTSLNDVQQQWLIQENREKEEEIQFLHERIKQYEFESDKHREQSDEENRQLRDEISQLRSALAQSGRQSSHSAASIPAMNHTTNIYNITKKRQVSPSRPMSVMSEHPDVLIEELEEKNAELRDNVNALKLSKQDLQRELQRCVEDLETTFQSKRDAEDQVAELSGELQANGNDLVTMQTERDEALRRLEYCEGEYQNWRDQAQEVIEVLVAEAEQRQQQMDNLQLELADATENFNSLSAEMMETSEAVVRLEDDHEVKNRRIQDLQKQVEDGNMESLELQKTIGEAREKISRLEGSLRGEIAFLREERDNFRLDLADATEKFNALQTERRKMSEMVIRLEDDHEVKNRRIQSLSREVMDGNTESAELDKAMGEAKEKIRRLEVQQESLQSKIVIFKEEQGGDKFKIKDLESNVKNLERQITNQKEFETALRQDRKKLQEVEHAFRQAMDERNTLLLALWNRLSGICGSDWTHDNSLINGRALPSMEAISGQMFGGFAKNLVASVKMVESIILGLRSHTCKPPIAPSKSGNTNTSQTSEFGGSTSTFRGIGAMPNQERGKLRKGLDEAMPEGLSGEEAWEWRMQEMERRLKEEREGRRLDRKNAERRLKEEGRARRECEEERRRERGKIERERQSMSTA